MPDSGDPFDWPSRAVVQARPLFHIPPPTVRRGRPVELSVISPTFNEVANIAVLVDALDDALVGVSWELIIVDDNSPDGTADAARSLYAADSRVRCLRRIGRSGLASACIEGVLASSAPFIAVIDADLQHDPALLPQMLHLLQTREADLVVGSRYVADGGVGGWDAGRTRISRFATDLTHRITPVPVQDPMSGYFAVRRDLFEQVAPKLSGIGFKILLDLMLSAPSGLRVRELPYTFRSRQFGQSKLTLAVSWEFALLLLDKTLGRLAPARFLTFACVGALGVGVHFAVLIALMRMNVEFAVGQTVATLTAMVMNYAVNNRVTYADRSNRGWRWMTGLASFMAVCGLGAVANVGISSFFVQQGTAWPIAALTGIGFGAVWNYAISNRYIWKRAR